MSAIGSTTAPESRPTVVSTSTSTSASGPIRMGNATIIGLHPTYSSSLTHVYASPTVASSAASRASIRSVVVVTATAVEKPESSSSNGNGTSLSSRAVPLQEELKAASTSASSSQDNNLGNSTAWTTTTMTTTKKTTTTAATEMMMTDAAMTNNNHPLPPSQALETHLITAEESAIDAAEGLSKSTSDTIPLSKAAASDSDSALLPTPEDSNIGFGAAVDKKVATASSPSCTFYSPHTTSLIDRDIAQLVPLILSLLQRHGPMDEDQLLSRLPPLSTSVLLKFTNQHPSPNGVLVLDSSQKYQLNGLILQDILQVLMALNVVHLLLEPPTMSRDTTMIPQDCASFSVPTPEFSKDTAKAATTSSLPHKPPPMLKNKKRYIFLEGVPRNEYDVIQPKDVYSLIQQANLEIDQSLERIRLLQDFLLLGSMAGGVKNNEGNTKAASMNPSSLSGVVDSTPVVQQQQQQQQGLGPIHIHGTTSKSQGGEVARTEALPVPLETTTCTTTTTKTVESSCIPLNNNNIRKNPIPMDPLQQTRTAREFLRNLLHRYPEIATDSVYFAALKNFSIDLNDRAKNTQQASVEGGGGGGHQDGDKIIDCLKKRRGRKRKGLEETTTTTTTGPCVTREERDIEK